MLLLLLLVSAVSSLRCYEGSKGLVNGAEQSNFREKTCEDKMEHCFLSYSDDWEDVTCQCQTPSTEEKVLDVCGSGCVYHDSINVTVCCCSSDLCNDPSPRITTAASQPPAAPEESNVSLS